MRHILSFLQKIGKSLMLPVSVLPIAGLLLGLGSAQFAIIPPFISSVMAQAGSSIFSNLPLIFAIGTALGLAQNDGVAALAAVVGYVVMLATMGVVAASTGVPTKIVMGIASINTGIFGGITIGLVSAFLFKRYYQLSLPAYLGFFAGKRSVPILTAFAAVGTGLLLSVLWPPLGRMIDGFSHWAAAENPAIAFSTYGFFERLLIPFGLHHIWNVPFFFQSGTYIDPATGKALTGEIARFVAGDPTAGNLAGGYLFKMWGLPAAAIAIWLRARPEQRKAVGGVMLSAALTCWLTGITEPLEFAFMFVAPVLYGVHALLCSAAFFVCIELGIKHSMTFSHGLVDFLVLFPHSQRALWFLWLGPLWAVMYFGIFWGLIGLFQYRTPGREQEEAAGTAKATSTGSAPSKLNPVFVLEALGGADNLVHLDACVTRLRVSVKDTALVDQNRLKQLGAAGIIVVPGGLQVIFGTLSENLKTQIERLIHEGSDATDELSEVIALLGGVGNILAKSQLNPTRWKLTLKEQTLVNTEAFMNDPVWALIPLSVAGGYQLVRAGRAPTS